jgi:peptidoglycan/LPS O-acetylase OafA/YrhL
VTPAQEPPKASKRRLEFLDAGRAIAATAVIVQHVGELVSPLFKSWTADCLDLGRVGVLLFFVISGFVIPFTLERGRSLRQFWINRVFRLYPLYWLSLALALLVGVLLHESRPALRHEPVLAALTNFTMLQDYFGVPDVLGLYWTLAYELAFYVALSLLFAVRLSRYADLLLIPIAGSHLLNVVLGHAAFGYLKGMFSLFLVGTVLYRAWTGERSWQRAGLLLGIWFVATMLNLYRSAAFGKDPHALPYATSLLSALILFASLFALRDRGFPTFLTFLGRISYSTYLMHGVLLLLLARAFHARPAEAIFGAIAVAGLTVPLSALTYRFVEEPAIAFGKRMASDNAAS